MNRPNSPHADEIQVIPILEETLDVQTQRRETGGVRITKVIHEREEQVNEPRVREELSVERIPLNRVVDGPVPVRHEGDTMIIPLLEEVMVVEKRLVLKEELRITKRRVVEHTPQHITLRREDATVERLPHPEQTANRTEKE